MSPTATAFSEQNFLPSRYPTMSSQTTARTAQLQAELAKKRQLLEAKKKAAAQASAAPTTASSNPNSVKV